MQAFQAVAAAVCLLAQYAAALAHNAHHNNPSSDLSAHNVGHRGAVDTTHLLATREPNTNQRVASHSNFIGPIFEWLSGEPATKVRNFTENVHSSAVEFTNIHRNKSIKKPFIEIQKSVAAYSDDQQRALVHFTLAQDTKAHSVRVASAKLTLKRLSDGDEYGAECPSKKIKITRINAPEGDAAKEPKTLGKTYTADVTDSDVTCDLTAMFTEDVAPADYHDFWLMLESEPMCYFTFDGKSANAYVALVLNKSITEVQQHQYSMMTPLALVGLVGLGTTIYLCTKNQTDYTYFQDQGEFIVDA
ncbi:cytochrome oxidase subunit I, putative [Babesia ovata]|uniref:Cytochrome oxidase subunit I, putative n=1 Tax=Babesia ovata TaxID=189622 RepID=A0A2H6KFK3_9APIC|nr:cytochrome oxidase subunit I, putative [Babesia ovata]GBE61767.1 cytochrome oxidase subunit I, putative [Babesia ovata]